MQKHRCADSKTLPISNDLKCPVCGSGLEPSGKKLVCSECGSAGFVRAGIAVFTRRGNLHAKNRTTVKMLGRLLDISYRISRYSVSLKPFIRFGTALNRKDGFLWDFDWHLQKRLLKNARQDASDEMLQAACVERWKDNLKELRRSSLESLNRCKRKRKLPGWLSEGPGQRESDAVKYFRKNGKLLYIGCGAGRECFRYAKRGFEVTGIDTNISLLKVLEKWSRYLDLPVKTACMDAYNMAFKPGTFDGVIIEFYGNNPDRTKNLLLQEELSAVLKPGGVCLLVGQRNKYYSFMNNIEIARRYPRKIADWLSRQAALDQFQPQEHDDTGTLMHGLFARTFTEGALAAELGHGFQMIDCHNEKDERYVVAFARPAGSRPGIPAISRASGRRAKKYSARLRGGLERYLAKLELCCKMLKAHDRALEGFIKKRGTIPSLSWRAKEVASAAVLLSELLGRTKGGKI